MDYLCALHPEVLITHFCQSCKDLACQICITKQPHSGSMHIVKQIKESADIRKNLYADYIYKQVNPIRSQANKKISTLQQFKRQIEKEKRVIEKDVKIQFEAINNRLNDKQRQSVLKKQNEIKHLQNYIHTLDDITNAFDAIYQNPQALLISYKTFQLQIRKLQSLKLILKKQEDQNIKVDLNRQYLNILHQSRTLQQYKDRNQFMNDLIQKYIKYYKDKIKQANQDSQKFGKQCRLIYNNALKKAVGDQIAKTCAFCGSPFTIQNLNQQCNNNRTYKLNCTDKSFDWQKIIPADMRGSKRHFWYKSSTTHRSKPKMQEHQIIRKTTKKNYFNSLQQLQTIKHVLKSYQIQKKKTFNQVVKENDPKSTGYISKIAFTYVLNKTYKLPMQQIQALIHLLENQKGIHYENLHKTLENPTEDYFKFAAVEEEIQKIKSHGPPSGQRPGSYQGYQSYSSSTQKPNQNNYSYGGGSSISYGGHGSFCGHNHK